MNTTEATRIQAKIDELQQELIDITAPKLTVADILVGQTFQRVGDDWDTYTYIKPAGIFSHYQSTARETADAYLDSRGLEVLYNQTNNSVCIIASDVEVVLVWKTKN